MGIVNGFVHIPRDLRAATAFEIQTFITRRCAPMLSRRLKSDKFIFGATTSFLDIIEGWQPAENDALVLTGDAAEYPAHFRTEKPLALMAGRHLGITFEARGDKFYCQATTETAALWIRLLYGLLSKIKKFFDLSLLMEGRPNAEFIDATKDLTNISSLLRMRGFRDILEIPSLHARLAKAIIMHQCE